MNPKLIVLVLVFFLSGCQTPAHVDSAEVVAQPIQAATAPAANDAAAVCPAVPPPVECPASESVTKNGLEAQVNEPAVDTVVAQSNEAQPVDKQADDKQADDKQADDKQADDKQADQQTTEQEMSVADVVAEEKPSAAEETFDIEKYVDQSASCMQQTPCEQANKDDTNPPASKAPDEIKSVESPTSTESPKSVEIAKPANAVNATVVNDRKKGADEGGIQKVERRRSMAAKREMPPDMPR